MGRRKCFNDPLKPRSRRAGTNSFWSDEIILSFFMTIPQLQMLDENSILRALVYETGDNTHWACSGHSGGNTWFATSRRANWRWARKSYSKSHVSDQIPAARPDAL